MQRERESVFRVSFGKIREESESDDDGLDPMADKIRQRRTRQKEKRQGKTRQDKTRQDKTRQGKDKTKQDRTR